jgi:hypothetical protein
VSDNDHRRWQGWKRYTSKQARENKPEGYGPSISCMEQNAKQNLNQRTLRIQRQFFDLIFLLLTSVTKFFFNEFGVGIVGWHFEFGHPLETFHYGRRR